MKIQILTQCWQCNGDGTANIPSKDGEIIINPCNVCDGNGYNRQSYLELEPLMPTCEILEATYLPEYSALNKNEETLYHSILALGFVNKSNCTNVKALLMNLFDEGTVTRANLQELFQW